MKQLSQKMINMKTSSVRNLTMFADEAEAKGKKVYSLNIGQSDLNIPPEYYEHIRKFNKPTVEYMPSRGIPELIEAVETYYRTAGISVSEENITITTGATEAVLFTLLALTNPEDEIIVFEPYYSNYNTFFTITGAIPVAVTTHIENGFHFEKEKLVANITEKTKAIWVTNPGNPTGTVLTKSEVRMIADVAKEYDLYIVADEVYREIVFDSRDITSFGFLDDIHDRLVIIDSVSKKFNACGTRIGAIITKNKDIFSIISKLCQGRLAVSTIEQHGVVGLYSTGYRVINEVRDEFQRRRDAVYEVLNSIPGVICKKPEGAFYIMAKLPVDDSNEFLKWMLKNFDVDGETMMAAPGEGFYATKGLGKNEIRIAYVLTPDKLKRSIQILEQGIRVYRNNLKTEEK